MHQIGVSEPAIPSPSAGVRPRLEAIDLWRGVIMLLMALDHTRDFLHHDILQYTATDLTKTSAALFLTRWVTHFCAPVFCFFGGTAAFLSLGRGKTTGEVSRFLITRGVWLIFLELTVVYVGWMFRFDYAIFGGQVIWALGWAMIVLGLLVYLPRWAIATFGVVMIAAHNLSDGVQPEAFGSFAWLWMMLHTGGGVQLAPGHVFFFAYPLVPWLGVMAAGYAFGAVLKRERAERRRIVLWLGVGLTAGFVLLRLSNLYGDPRPWSAQPTALFTLFSFLNCSKYPPSLLYLLMTLGPSLIALAALDRDLGRWARPIIVFGRVPLFFYLLHIPLIHGVAVLFSYLRYGRADWLFIMPPFWGAEAAQAYPPDYGYGLGAVYLIWLGVVLALYLPCRWFADLKQRRRDPWLSYL